MNEPYRLRYTNQIVGFFLLLLLIATIVIGVAITRASRILVKPDKFYINVTEEQASDLRTGTEVIVLGRRIGQIEELTYTDDTTNLVRVMLAIDPRYSSQITTDSEVTLDRKFGLGTPVLKIGRKAVGERQGPLVPIEPGNQISQFIGEIDRVEQMAKEVEGVGNSIENVEKELTPTLRSVNLAAQRITKSIDENISPATEQGKKTLESIELTSETIRPETVKTMEAIRESTKQLEIKVADLTDRIRILVDGDVRDAVTSLDQTADASTDAARAVEKTATNLDAQASQTKEEISATLQSLRQTAELIQKLTNETREIVRIVRSEAEELPGTAERVNQTVSETQDLVGEIRSHWLLRRYHRADSPTEPVPPSHARGGTTP
jgi:phospholipid/cholesterol/gamma-HCH transport system substrate-binding protein